MLRVSPFRGSVTDMRRPRLSPRTAIINTVPSLLGWRTFPRAAINLLAFSLAAAASTWVVHQLAYRIEYGDRFGAVMATTPHRVYMAPLGVALGMSVGGVLVLSILIVGAARVTVRRLLRNLPARLIWISHASAPAVPGTTVARTALLLAACQLTLYSVQENLESVFVSAGWPGLSVLLSSEHVVVVPLHLLAAACGSLLLWTVSSRVRGSRQAVQMAWVLAGIAAARGSVPQRTGLQYRHLPNLRLVAGSLCLRSPPLAA